jgi:hypothetical protein
MELIRVEAANSAQGTTISSMDTVPLVLPMTTITRHPSNAHAPWDISYPNKEYVFPNANQTKFSIN